MSEKRDIRGCCGATGVGLSEHARRAHSQLSSELAGWFTFQPPYEKVVADEPDLLD